MTTQAQIEANRLNAQKSTGPVTPEGKTIASQNALKHGLLARRFLIDGTERGEFDRFRLRLLADLKPVGFMETVLADRIASLLGETTAETKVALAKLKEYLSHE